MISGATLALLILHLSGAVNLSWWIIASPALGYLTLVLLFFFFMRITE